jgi:hypothetical protein
MFGNLQFAAFTLLALVQAGPGPTPNRTYTPLDGNREKLVFQPYSPQQRSEVAQDLVNMFNVYANRYKKIEAYDVEHKARFGVTIDPVPRSEALAKKASALTDIEFHYAFSDLFNSLRDLHSTYIMPAPHGCFSFIQGASFAIVSNRTLIVAGFAIQPEVQALTKEVISKMTVGDILLTINGKTFEEYQQEVKWDHGGNSESGLLRRSLAWLSSRSGRFAKLPAEKEVVYELQSIKDASKYKVTMPWILSQRDDCLGAYNAFASIKTPTSLKMVDGAVAKQPETQASNAAAIKKAKKAMMRPIDYTDVLDDFKESFELVPESPKLVFNPTTDPIVNWAIFEPETRNLGVLSVSSFSPLGSDDDAVILLIRSLLLKELKDTSSLVIDMRNNGGGSIRMGDLLPQLFGGAAPYQPNIRRAVTGMLIELTIRSY